MYDILNLYEEDYDPKKPLICLDKKPKQLIRDKRMTIPMKHGSLEKYDYEYVRNGTANIFMAVEFKAGKRVTQVTKIRLKHLKYKIKHIRHCDWYSVLYSWRFNAIDFSVQPRKSYKRRTMTDFAQFVIILVTEEYSE